MAKHERWFLGALVGALLAGHVIATAAAGKLGDNLSGGDDLYYFAILRSLVFDGDFDFTNEFNVLKPLPPDIRPATVATTNRPANKYGVGWALVSLIPYLAVHLALHLIAIFRGGFHYTGYEAPYLVACSLAQVLAGGLAVVFAYLAGRRFFSARQCGAATVLLLAGTPLLFYTLDEVYMSHACGALAVSMFVLAVIRIGEAHALRRLDWALLGLGAALMVVTRYSNAVFLSVGVLLLGQRRSRSEWTAGLSVAAAIALPIVFVQCSLWHGIYGSWFTNSYGEAREDFHWLHPALLAYVFSHRHGIVFYSPLTSIAWLGGLSLLSARPAPMPRLLAAGMLSSLAALVYVNAAWHMWWFGHAFGARSYVESYPLLVIGLARAFDARSPSLRRAAAVAAMLCVVWTILLWVLYASRQIDHDGQTGAAEIIRLLGTLIGR